MQKKLKKLVILYPAHYLLSSGGAELQISYLVEALIKNEGYNISYIYSSNKNLPQDNNVDLYPIPRKKKIKFLGQAWFRYKKDILEKLYEIKPDIIYTRGQYWIDIAAEYAVKNNIKHIHAIASDNDVVRRMLRGTFFPLDKQIENCLVNKGIKNCTKLIVQNKFQQNTLHKRFNVESLLINQMTPFVNADLLPQKAEKINIVWIANLKPTKRPELFINLANSLSDYSDRIEMFMCGRFDEQYSDTLSKCKNVKYLEELPQNEVFELLNKSHILVNTSTHEGFSNTFVQAWMRKVVVVSMESNPNNAITDNNLGFITPTEEELLKAIKYLIDNPSELLQMSDASYSFVCENHCKEKEMNKVLQIL